MIQFNLLPDIKIDYIKSQRQKRLVILVSTISTVVAITLLILLIVIVDILQKKNISDLTTDIKTNSQQLQNTPDLTKILTVQNQLGALTTLHNDKPVASRLFSFLSQVTPTSVTIAKINVDFSANTMLINGSADTLNSVNTYTDAVKFTTFKTANSSTSKKAFSDVVLASFGRDSKGATYGISFKFDPTIFSEESNVTLTVPKITSTRSEVEQPSALFQKSDTTTPTGTTR